MNNILRQQFTNHIGQTSPSPMMVEVEHASGSYFYTPEGRRYLDLVAGVSVSNVGHCNPQVVEAVQQQAARYMHVMVYGELVERPQVEYATLLAQYLPGDISSIYFLSSGAEAVEGALKLAKRYSGRSEIISMRRAYHGSTHGALSLMSREDGEEWRAPFEPLLSDVRSIEYNDFEALDQITERTAGVVVEAVQGEAGVRLPKEGWLEALRARCTQMGALLIFDEIQTGMGRTGEMFGSVKYGVTPDIICLAKALGGGMPLGAFCASERVMSTLSHDPVLGHITTFGGHPVSCAAGMAAMRYLIDNDVVASVEAKGALFEQLLCDHAAILEVRRSGLLMAMEMGEAARLYRLMELYKECGILSDWFLFCDTAFRISPPLTITEQEIEEGCRVIRAALDTIIDEFGAIKQQ